MMTVRPATQAWLPRALETSADRYGSIGVAFTYLTWLYIASWVLLATAVLGQVIAIDPGRLGERIRGRTGRPPRTEEIETRRVSRMEAFAAVAVLATIVAWCVLAVRLERAWLSAPLVFVAAGYVFAQALGLFHPDVDPELVR